LVTQLADLSRDSYTHPDLPLPMARSHATKKSETTTKKTRYHAQVLLNGTWMTGGYVGCESPDLDICQMALGTLQDAFPRSPTRIIRRTVETKEEILAEFEVA
jgi:hypothetical protein